jgi:hypothetical protein
MIKVRFVRELGVGVAGAAALAGAGAHMTACAAPTSDVGNSSAATTVVTSTNPIAPGTGSLALADMQLAYASTSGGDEFIRTGETLALTLSWNDVYWSLCNTQCNTIENVDPSRFQGVANIRFFATDGSVASTAQLAVHWDASGDGAATTDSFVVPPSVPHFAVSFAFTDTYTGTTVSFTEGQVGHSQFAVFGAFLPNKEVLFDNDQGGNARQRVIEGGPLVAGANVTLSFADWRADRVVNKDSLNLTIGQGTSESRFGVQNIAIQGQLTYNVAAVYSTDGGNTWSAPLNLPGVQNPDDLSNPTSYGRTAYQATLQLPGGATDFLVAFHVQAILTANPNYEYVNTWDQAPNGQTYQLGQQYVLVDTWDNNGSADGNYEVAVVQGSN